MKLPDRVKLRRYVNAEGWMWGAVNWIGLAAGYIGDGVIALLSAFGLFERISCCPSYARNKLCRPMSAMLVYSALLKVGEWATSDWLKTPFRIGILLPPRDGHLVRGGVGGGSGICPGRWRAYALADSRVTCARTTCCL